MPTFPPPVLPPGELAARVAASFSAQVTTAAVALYGLTFPGLAALLALASAFAAQAHGAGLQRACDAMQQGDSKRAATLLHRIGPAPVAIVVGTGLPSVAMGLAMWSALSQFVAAFMIAFGKTANLPPGSDRGAYITAAMIPIRESLDARVAFAYATLAVATLAAAVLVRAFAGPAVEPAHASEVQAVTSQARASWVWSVLLIGAAAALIVHTEPLRRENTTPWPAPDPVSLAVRLMTTTPDLRPSDVAPVAPVLSLDRGARWLDGRRLEGDSLAADLATLKRHWASLHPDGDFEGNMIVGCSAATASTEISRALTEGAQAGYRTVWFAFGRTLVHVRPRVGTVRLSRTRFARAAFSASEQPPAGDVVSLDLAALADCAAVSSAVTLARAEGREVVIRLPPPQPAIVEPPAR